MSIGFTQAYTFKSKHTKRIIWKVNYTYITNTEFEIWDLKKDSQ